MVADVTLLALPLLLLLLVLLLLLLLLLMLLLSRLLVLLVDAVEGVIVLVAEVDAVVTVRVEDVVVGVAVVVPLVVDVVVLVATDGRRTIMTTASSKNRTALRTPSICGHRDRKKCLPCFATQEPAELDACDTCCASLVKSEDLMAEGDDPFLVKFVGDVADTFLAESTGSVVVLCNGLFCRIQWVCCGILQSSGQGSSGQGADKTSPAAASQVLTRQVLAPSSRETT